MNIVPPKAREKEPQEKARRLARRADFARKIGADYNRRWLNCNVAETRFCALRPLGLPPLARPAKGRPQVGAKMAKSPARPSKTSPNKATSAGADKAQARGTDA
ncbi:MAG: hypothetical protein WAN27_15810, partial [Xanthobacteraceae bacterium]